MSKALGLRKPYSVSVLEQPPYPVNLRNAWFFRVRKLERLLLAICLVTDQAQIFTTAKVLVLKKLEIAVAISM